MATETTRQIIQEAPEIEAKRLELLNAVRNFVDQNLFAVGQEAPPPVLPPAFQVAGLTPLQQQAAARAAQGVGAFQPFVDNTLDALRRSEDYAETYGFGGLTEALGATREGQQALSQAAQLAAAQRAQPFAYQQAATQALVGTDAAFDPRGIGAFMNPFEDQVVQQALADIDRGSQLQRQQLGAQAAATGAFGGSRQAVAESELNRALEEQKARTAAQLRLAGFQQASQDAQRSFEAAQARRLQQAQQVGNLGLQFGQLGQADVGQLASLGQASAQMGQGFGTLAQTGGQLSNELANRGLQQAGLGQLQQQLNLGDVKTLEALGARDQALQQAILDAQRQSNLQLQQFPYQQYAFLSDVYKGTPSSQQVTQMTQTQDPSVFQQVAGLGIAGLSAAAGAKKIGLFDS